MMTNKEDETTEKREKAKIVQLGKAKRLKKRNEKRQNTKNIRTRINKQERKEQRTNDKNRQG